MIKGRLKKTFVLEEIPVDTSLITRGDRDLAFFHEGMELEIIKKVKPNSYGHSLFIVYSPQLNEATVVSEQYLEIESDPNKV